MTKCTCNRVMWVSLLIQLSCQLTYLRWRVGIPKSFRIVRLSVVNKLSQVYHVNIINVHCLSISHVISYLELAGMFVTTTTNGCQEIRRLLDGTYQWRMSIHQLNRINYRRTSWLRNLAGSCMGASCTSSNRRSHCSSQHGVFRGRKSENQWQPLSNKMPLWKPLP